MEHPIPHNRLRHINKHFINRLTRWLAYLPLGPLAVIYHTGRRSGKLYEATMMVEPVGDQLVFALTYGEEVDWYRNVKAAGKASLLWHCKVYQLDKPEPLDAHQALQNYPALEKWFLRKLGTQHFIHMSYRQETSPGKNSSARS